MFDSILIVCLGNICRSPTGEYILKNLMPNKKISSAGLNSLIGNRADPMALKIAHENNISLENHKSRQLTPQICREYDLILVMEKKQIDLINRISPETRGKVMLFGYWLDEIEIHDPYKQSREAFEIVFKLINEAAQKWALVLNSKQGDYGK
jgi:protein-tyrosine phosphatase